MEASIGKLKNTEGGTELPFVLTPAEYRLSRNLDFSVEPCLGQSAPVVAYRSGGAAELALQLAFDQDADKACDVKKVHTFLRDINKVLPKTKSVPVVEFTL